MTIVRPQPLTPEAFAAFGEVVSTSNGAGKSANQGSAIRFDFAAVLENGRPGPDGAKPNIAVFRSMPRELPFAIKMLERHPESTQFFAPLLVQRYVVVVAPDDEKGEPDLSKLSAFLAAPGQAVNYKRGLWHHPLIVLGSAADFVMLAWEDGSKRDCEERVIREPLTLVVDD